MDNLLVRICRVSISFVVVSCIILLLSTAILEDYESKNVDQDYTLITDEIAYENLSTGEVGYYVPGDTVASEYNEVVRFTFDLEDHENEYISFYTSYVKVEVFVDGALVYSYGEGETMAPFITAPPSKWHEVPLNDQSIQHVEIQLTDLNKRYDMSIAQLGVGSQAEISTYLTSTNLVEFLTSITFIFIGFTLLVIFLYALTKGVRNTYMGLLSVFVFNIGIYTLTQSTLFENYLSTPIFCYLLGYMTLYLIPITYLYFCKDSIILERNRLRIQINATICTIFFTAITLSQLFGIYEYYQGFNIFAVLVFGSFILICTTLWKDYRATNSKRTYRLLVSTFILALFTVAQIMIYWFSQPIMDLKFFKIGLGIFLICLSIDSLMQFRKSLLEKKQSKQLNKLAFVDTLTGYGNRNAFYEALESLRFNQVTLVYVIYCDMNDLKAINDTYGHNTGDIAITAIPSLIQKNVNAVVYRIGGDEFTALMMNTSEEDVQKVVTKINSSIGTIIADNGDTVNISISAGYGRFTFETGEDIKTVISSADKMMYEKKSLNKKM